MRDRDETPTVCEQSEVMRDGSTITRWRSRRVAGAVVTAAEGLRHPEAMREASGERAGGEGGGGGELGGDPGRVLVERRPRVYASRGTEDGTQEEPSIDAKAVENNIAAAGVQGALQGGEEPPRRSAGSCVVPQDVGGEGALPGCPLTAVRASFAHLLSETFSSV